MFGLTPAELRQFRKLSSPRKVQRFLDKDIRYNVEQGGETCRSPRRVLRDRLAHCFEGALFAAAAMRVNGRKPLIIDLVAHRDDDHVIAVFKEHGLWGAVAQSNYSGLGYRAPVYRTVRELVMSYFEEYFNHAKEYTLRAFSMPLNISRWDYLGWMTAEKELFILSELLKDIRHYPLIPEGLRLGGIRPRVYKAGCVGQVKH